MYNFCTHIHTIWSMHASGTDLCARKHAYLKLCGPKTNCIKTSSAAFPKPPLGSRRKFLGSRRCPWGRGWVGPGSRLSSFPPRGPWVREVVRWGREKQIAHYGVAAWKSLGTADLVCQHPECCPWIRHLFGVEASDTSSRAIPRLGDHLVPKRIARRQ
jgi:hypothetical protein